MCRNADILDDLAVSAMTLAARPRHVGARQAVRRAVAAWRQLRAEEQAARIKQSLIDAAEAADAEARQAVGWRADIDG